MVLVKLPVPDPSLVVLSPVVGFDVVAQQTPRIVTDEPPSSVIFPPDVAVVEATDERAVAVTVGFVIGLVVNETSLPYEVPTPFVA
jgi:hypothetical protein